MAYDPLFVAALGHHMLLIGVCSFAVTVLKMPLQSAARFITCGEEATPVYIACTGGREYKPWLWELNRPIPAALAFAYASETLAPGETTQAFLVFAKGGLK